MNTLKSKLEKLQQRRNEDEEILSAECRDTVDEFKQDLIKKIVALAVTALDDLAKCDIEQRLAIKQHVHTCNTALSRMELHYKLFEEAVIACINPLIFVHNLQLENTLEQVDSILQDLGKEVKEPDIAFVLNETLRMSDVKSLGVVRSTSMTDTRPVIADTKIESVEQIDVKFQGDQSELCITGSLFMPNGEFILCDYNNSSVKVLKSDFTQKDHIKLSRTPYDLCLIENDGIVISQPDAKSLLFMKVAPKLQTGSSITLDQSCFGVTVRDGLIYVSYLNGEIRILDRTGQPQTNVYSGFSFKDPYYISVMPTGIVYIYLSAIVTLLEF